MNASLLSVQPMHAATEMDTMSNKSALKIVNDENDITPVTPLDERQGGIFASLKAVFSGGVFGTETKKNEKTTLGQLEDSIVIEKKSSEEDENDSEEEKKQADMGNEGQDDGQENGLPQTEECEDYAYQSSSDESEEVEDDLQQRESVDLLNEAQISSKPMQMSVLDDLENYWEKTDAIHGKKGVLAEHIMDRQANDAMNGSAAKEK